MFWLELELMLFKPQTIAHVMKNQIKMHAADVRVGLIRK